MTKHHRNYRFQPRLTGLLLAAATLLLPALVPALLPGISQAQSFPNKSMRMVITASPGGITDILGRLVAEQVQKSTGQAMVVENRTGAGGNIGTQFVAKATPDGYTMGIANVGNFCINRWLYKDMGFDPINDLMGVALVADGPSIIGVWDKLPPKTLKELVAYGKSSGNKLNYGSAGAGTMPHLAADLFGRMTGVELVHIPYKGANPAALDLATGRIELAFIALGSMRAQIAAGMVRPVAVAAKQRLAALPDVPTFAEAGLPQYDVTNGFGIMAPKGTPMEAVSVVNRAVAVMLKDPSVLKRLNDGGMLAMHESAEDFQKRIVADDIKWRDIVKAAGIQPQ